MSTKNLLDTYRAMLVMAGLTVTDDGCVSVFDGETHKPLTIKGKRLVLMTDAHLANPDWEHRICFHPGLENIGAGESVVLDRYRQALVSNINVVFTLLVRSLLTLGTSNAEHAKLSPDQADVFLPKLKNADGKTVDDVNAMLDKIPATQMTKLFVSIFVRRGGSFKGERCSRLGVVSFPFYQELKKEGTEVFGTKLRVKDKETLIKLLDFIMPGMDDAERYNRPTNSRTAPNLEALVTAALGVIEPLNDLVVLYRDFLPEDAYIETDCSEDFTDFSLMLGEIRKFPMQAGNEGTPAKAIDQQQVAAPMIPVAAANTQAFPQVFNPAIPFGQQAVYQVQPPLHSNPAILNNGATDFMALIRHSPQLAASLNQGVQFQNAQPQNTRATYSNPVVNNGNQFGNNNWNNQQQYQNNQYQPTL